MNDRSAESSTTIPADLTPTPADVRAAAERIRPYAHRTPVLTCAGLDAIAGARLHFKCENLRKVEDRFNDRISSIRVFGRAQGIVYEHENFGGASRTFVGDVSNLESLNNKITSIDVR